jgi:hypothetical protein
VDGYQHQTSCKFGLAVSTSQGAVFQTCFN